MSQDYETKRSDLHASRDEPAGDRPAAEDPLVELARIVHKNKQSGANVSSGRVGSTDYFAGLEDVAVDPVPSTAPQTTRREPTFAPVTPVAEAPAFEQPIEPERGQTAAQPTITPTLDHPSPAFEAPKEPGAAQSSHVSSLWPDIQTPDPVVPAPEPTAPLRVEPTPEPVSAPDVQTPNTGSFERVAANDQTNLKPDLSVDLEQNLTAELEDELIGALRHSVDETPPLVEPQVTAPIATSAPADVEPPFQAGLTSEKLASDSIASSLEEELRQAHAGVRPEDQYRVELTATPADAPAPVTTPVSEVVTEPVVASPSFEAYSSQVTQPVSVSPVQRDAPRLETRGFDEPATAAPRPRIDENDLFAALNPAAEAPAATQPLAEPEAPGEPAGIDALFADLDFPPPGERRAGAAAAEVSEPAPEDAASDIDDMTWPAAAAEVPKTEDEETPPPPEGYDLDAVARAMQESDPSLTGAGVLPPHSAAEKEAVPQAKEKSRRGLFVAAGVMGVAVLGAAGFFLVDSDGVVVPSGPPPVISGLQDPLKIYPEETPVPTDDTATKMIYDRVNDTTGAAPSNLVLPETPQPAELPPAPAGTNGGADLVPGAPKRVRTVIVRPDGTFVSPDEPAAPQAAAPAPAAAPELAAPAVSDAPVPVATTPITAEPAAAQPEVPVVTPEPAAPTPSVPDAPAIVAGTGETPAAQPDTQPAQDIVSVLPRKKPAAPVQVASAPPAAAVPAPAAPAAQTTGPLNLGQTASAPAAPAATPAPAGTTGTIPSGTYIVQVTSQRSAAAASDAYSGLQRRFPAILGSRNAVIVSANVQDRGVFYRARIPTTSREEAISLCESLQTAGGDCFVRRQP